MTTIDVEDLSHTLFDLYLAHDHNAKDPELWARIAQIRIISSDEDEVVAALCELHDMIAAELRRRH